MKRSLQIYVFDIGSFFVEKSNVYYIKKVKGKPMYHYDIQVQATMAEEMELQAFPFDEQDLSKKKL